MGVQKTKDQHVFEELEDDLEQAGFSVAETSQVIEVMHDPSLLCRSESFEKVMSLLLRHEDIDVANKGDKANMCVMGGGEGFRVAMMEGFGGKEVGGIIKTVVSFKKEHLIAVEPIERGSPLWDMKRRTAEVSLRAKGVIREEDVQMVSFRFPAEFFPAALLTEEETERADDENIAFVVRHYVR